GGRDLLHDRRQRLSDRARTHSGDERQPSGLTFGVELVDQPQEVVRLRPGADLDADRVADPGDEVDVRSAQVPGALPHPHEVTGDVIGQPGAGVDARQRTLVVQQQRLVAGAIPGRRRALVYAHDAPA